MGLSMSNESDIYIIGSGLSAMAAATALVERGYLPTVLDAGLVPDSSAVALKSRLALDEPSQWKAEDLAQLRQTGPSALNGIPRKMYFGSDFSFQSANGAHPLEVAAASVHRSFAVGGFSNLWGAVIEEFSSKDLKDWPLTNGDLEPHYAAMHALVQDKPLSAAVEGIPDYQLRPSSQAHALFKDLSVGQTELREGGIRFGPPQLAVRATGPNGEDACRYCGQCLHGCPYECRYTAAETLARLTRAGQIRYLPGVLVERLLSQNGLIQIQTRAASGDERRSFSGKRVFVAAGMLESTRIILASLELYGKPVHAGHSDIFTLPLIRYHAAPGISRENIHTLCQLVAEVDIPHISAHPVHLQFYGYNDLYLQIMRLRAGWTAPFLTPALRAIAARLFVAFGYLHSSVSSKLVLTLSSEGAGRLLVRGEPNPLARTIAKAAARKLFQKRRLLKAMPVLAELRLDLPGGGYHSGGTFPMSETPDFPETDSLGRLRELHGVHLVDASILPAIPASTIAFTVMANAHRIASDCPMPHAE